MNNLEVTNNQTGALRNDLAALVGGMKVISAVVIGLAAQSTLGNLVAGVSITIYRPFRLGDTLQVTAPTGTETGCVEAISLGYTTLRTGDGRHGGPAQQRGREPGHH